MNYGSDNHKEAIATACKELEAQGFKTIPIKGKIPDIIAYKGEIAFIEVQAQGDIAKAKREHEKAYNDIPLKIFKFRTEAQTFQRYRISPELVMGFISPEVVR